LNAISHLILNFFKGMLIGIGAIIPGLSGGTIAVTLGIFEDLLNSVSDIFRSFKKSSILLISVALGGIFGIFIFTPVIKVLCELYSSYVNYIFCLISLISALFFIRKSIGFKNIRFVFLVLGIIVAFVFSFLVENYKLTANTNNPICLLILGVTLALALILPAVSFSYMMLFFGIYESFLDAINNLDFNFLVPLSLGIIFGTYILSILLNKLIKLHSKEAYSFVFGFVCISIIDILV